ncbi:DNA-binding transcriptional LysR family regulator [Stella humosa]|uniref:DNA-binding transcriptional LysR family regulator n=1 Tax=Stella humosa TaxID=94 RepID=A0A3N1L4E0_9PROT|nr:LysR substrate-binding domain-containing protein [Stella humosa]ROP84275.1 DNA-binding transcriptional LysR family regulator [Stella humosa]BBK33788.1 LysR family transcriptional regulator [Stella humosa]
MVTLRQLEVLCAVIETGSVTGASRRLNLSQPAVSKLLATLERHIQLVLFRREHRRLVATPEAHRLYEESQHLLVGLTDVARLAEELRSLSSGTLAIASLLALGHRLLPEVVGRFLRARPAVNFSYQVRSSNKIMQWVVTNRIDLGIAMHSIDHDAIETETLRTVEAVCALPADHPLAARPWIAADDLTGQRFISFGSEGRIQDAVDEMFDSLGIRRRIIGRVFNSASACSLVAQGLGVAIVDPFSAADFAGSGVVARPFRPAISYQFKLLYPRSRERSKLLNAFVPMLKAAARDWPVPVAPPDTPA